MVDFQALLNSGYEILKGSLEKIVVILIIIFVTVILAKIVKWLIGRAFKRSSKLFKVDKTTINFLKHFSVGIIYVVGFSFAIHTIPSLRAVSVSILASAGVLAIIIGFASQQAFANIVSGIFINIFKPFRVGDRIRIQNSIYGVVEDITLRHTVIRTFENIRHVIPNSKISEETIENQSIGDERVRKYVDMSISYDSDIDKAIKIMQKEIMKHPDYLGEVDKDEPDADTPVKVRLVSFGDSSVNLRARVWTKNPSAAFRLKTDLYKSIKKRFDKEGIEIPFPYRTIVYKKDQGKKDISRKK